MIADPAELAGRQRVLADPGVAVGGDDQIGVGGDLGGHHQLGIGLHHHVDAGGLGGRGEAVIRIGHHHPHDPNAVLAKHVQGGHAEMAGADEGNAHGCLIRLADASSPDNTSGRPVTTCAAFAPVINNAQSAQGAVNSAIAQSPAQVLP